MSKKMAKHEVEDKSKGASRGKLFWTITSDFGGDDDIVVTLILNNPATGNTFYDKHVLRKDEDAAEILRLRNSEKVNSPMFDPEKVNVASAMGIKSSGAPASTVVSLKGMDFNGMIFTFANALVKAKKAGEFGAMNQNVDVEVVFSTPNCVITVRPGGSPSKCQSMEVGAQLQADTVDAMQFEVNHCAGAGSE